MKTTIYHESGLAMIPINNLWAVGYKPSQNKIDAMGKTFCLGELSELADMFEENEYAVFRFITDEKGLRPIHLLHMDSEEAENHSLKPNEIRAKIGCFWVLPKNFNPTWSAPEQVMKDLRDKEDEKLILND